MSYSVKMTQSAIEQTREIIAYISGILMAPETALRWSERLKAEIKKLSFMPGRVPLTEEEPWHDAGIHKLVVQNFLVYFWIDEEHSEVWVTGVIYNRRERIASLLNMPLQ
ncbi:MAG: type II toxin-antitoxin system RelE/ParE family toxin [Eubacteriales bacterium]|nr:type II toxin-antitoxin system RelE/ParE family toxin [Eubacteriales bacterium]